MKEYIAIKTCFWGPTPGTQTMYVKDTRIMAYGTEPGLLEFFKPVAVPPSGPPVQEEPKPKGKPGPKPRKPAADDLNDL